jgi:methylmalonyl-CoA mutase cobalamin-binding subunit
MAAVVAEETGWDVIYLGTNLPADEIGIGARSLGVSAVALSVVYMDDGEKVAEEIRLIGQQLGPQVAMIVGGRVAAVLADTVREAGGIPVEDLDELREQLDRLHNRSKR